MIYLSGCVRADLPDRVGVCLTPMMGNRLPDGLTWAADTGCYGQPTRHDDDRYLAWLADRQHAVSRCLFATAPDVVQDADATMARALPMLPRIREVGFKAALVAQDGLEDMDVPWDAFDVLFVGGSTSWKLSEAADQIVAEAKWRGKWAHAGRVNSLRRLRRCAVSGYDSADGTFLAFGPDVNLPRLRGWLDDLDRSPSLVLMSGAGVTA